MTVCKCSDVSISKEGREVISNLNFEILDGDYLFIGGDNEVGISALVDAMLGIEKNVSGHIDFAEGIKPEQMGFVPANTGVNDDFPATVEQIVLSGCVNRHGFFLKMRKDEKQRSEQILADLHIEDIRKRTFRELSGGQKKKVMLARALMASKKLLILDEPVAALDPIAAVELYNTIEELHKKGLTIVVISRDSYVANRYADKILILSKNSDDFFGTVSEFQRQFILRMF